MGASLPDPVSSMLPTAGEVLSGAGWALEWKWDGVRAIVAAVPSSVRATSRNDRDITASYPELDALGELVDRSVLLDGELVTWDQHGRPDFGWLRSRMHVRQPSKALLRSAPVLFYVFDLLHLDGPLLSKPNVQWRELWEQLQLTDGPVAPWPTTPTSPPRYGCRRVRLGYVGDPRGSPALGAAPGHGSRH